MFPESPRWLVLKNRIEDARESFAVIEDIDPEDERVNLDIDAVARVNDMLSEGSSFLSLFRYGKDKTVWRVVLAVSCQFFTQMNGAGLITYYSKQLFENIGISADLAGILSGTSLLFKFICCFIAFATIEMAGRKRLFLISMTGMAMCMVSRSVDITSNVTATNYIVIVLPSHMWFAGDRKQQGSILCRHRFCVRLCLLLAHRLLGRQFPVLPGDHQHPIPSPSGWHLNSHALAQRSSSRS
jgi:hypothetical protein